MRSARKQNEVIEYAKGRAARWGSVLREAGWHGAPNANYYRETPYLIRRGDPAFDNVRHEHNERELQAAVVDKFYRALRESHLKAAEAMWLQYVASQPGTHKALKHKDKMNQWRGLTKRGERQFYHWLAFAVDGLSLYLIEITE